MNISPEQMESIQYQQEHYNDDRRGLLNGTIWALWGLAVVVLILRFYAKKVVRSKFKAEDVFILLGMVRLNNVEGIHKTDQLNSCL